VLQTQNRQCKESNYCFWDSTGVHFARFTAPAWILIAQEKNVQVVNTEQEGYAS
jgi:hypothetical protein